MRKPASVARLGPTYVAEEALDSRLQFQRKHDAHTLGSSHQSHLNLHNYIKDFTT